MVLFLEIKVNTIIAFISSYYVWAARALPREAQMQGVEGARARALPKAGPNI